MRARKNDPVDHLEAPGLISRNGIQIAGGYFTNTIDTSLASNSASDTLPPTPTPTGVPVSLSICINGSAYNIDIYSVNGLSLIHI